MTRMLNLKFLACLLGGIVLLGTGIHFLHGFQVKRNASALLEQAKKKEIKIEKNGSKKKKKKKKKNRKKWK